jgi:hypothetical protein
MGMGHGALGIGHWALGIGHGRQGEKSERRLPPLRTSGRQGGQIKNDY